MVPTFADDVQARADHNAGRAAFHAGQAYDSIPKAFLSGWMAAATEKAQEAEAKRLAAGHAPDPWAHGQRRELSPSSLPHSHDVL